jgi:hypothetical protein
LKPGQPYGFTIEKYPTSLVFKKRIASGWTSPAATVDRRVGFPEDCPEVFFWEVRGATGSILVV